MAPHLQRQIAALAAQLSALQAQVSAESEESDALPAAAKQNRYSKVEPARAVSVSSAASSAAASTTTACYRTGQAPVVISSNYFVGGGVAVPVGSSPPSQAAAGGGASAAEEKVVGFAVPVGSSQACGAEEEDDGDFALVDGADMVHSGAAKKPATVVAKPFINMTFSEDRAKGFEWENIPHLVALCAADAKTWPTVTCSMYECGFQEHWKRFECHKVYHKIEEVKGDGDDEFTHFRVCWMCVGRREGLVDKETGKPLEGASRAWIASSKPDFKRKMKETDKFKTAKLHVQKIFPMMKACSLKNKAIQQLESIDSFAALFAPMVEFIMIKDMQMEKMSEEAAEAVRLMHELRMCVNPAVIPDLLDRIKLASLDAPMLAFEGQEDANRKWLATTFADEWTGCMGGWFRSYYICAHGCKWNGLKPVFHDGCCCTVTPSKTWDRKHEDPMAPKQAYYCHVNHKYNASWGQLIEMRTLSGNMLYSWAQIPGCHIQDIRALKIEAACP